MPSKLSRIEHLIPNSFCLKSYNSPKQVTTIKSKHTLNFNKPQNTAILPIFILKCPRNAPEKSLVFRRDRKIGGVLGGVL